MFTSSRKSFLSCALLGTAFAGAMVIGASNINAQIILTPPVGVGNGNPVIAPNGSNFNWTYSILLGPGTSVASGDSFAIVDFGGFVGTPTLTNLLSSGFTVSQTYAYLLGGMQDTNPTGNGYNDPATADVVLTYNGPTISNSSYSATMPLGDLTLTAEVSTSKSGGISSVSEYYPSGNADQYSATTPVPSVAIPAGPLPLPATFWPGLGTLAAMALVGGVKLRKKFV